MIFPLLTDTSRRAFRLAFAVFVVALVGLGLLRWKPPLIAIVTLGMPLLFGAYLLEQRAVAESSSGTLLVTAALSVLLGIGWALGADAATAAQGDALGIPPSSTRILLVALAIPLGYVACLLAGLLIVWRWRPGVRKPLNGFLIGSLVGYLFTAAGTATRLAPEFTADPNQDHIRSAVGLALAAAVQGIALPVIAAATTGAVGVALWTVPVRTTRWYRLPSPIPAVAFVVAGYLGLGVLDVWAPGEAVEWTCYALCAVAALVFARVVLHRALRDADTADPERSAGARARTTRILIGAAAASVVAMVAAVALSTALRPPKPSYVCPPDCGRPPVSKPVSTNPRFTPSTGEFSVSYPGEGTAYAATFEPNGVVLQLMAGDGGVLRLFGQPAQGRSARELAKQLIADHYRGATTAYEIPNALVGYQLGYGEVADVFPSASVADDSRNRVLVMVAVKHDYALFAAGAGPFHEFSQDFGSGHPSGANFLLALDMGKYVNSFAWRGDPPR